MVDFLSQKMEGEPTRFTQGKQREKQILHGINKVVELSRVFQSIMKLLSSHIMNSTSYVLTT